ncbi:hypothetical protein M422DRAFT_242580 [Sphaerobolus stellatus SS14]|nr:hypothetical protein M422DRAFT_242580 [Sphaerobolus stellatus SS14]
MSIKLSLYEVIEAPDSADDVSAPKTKDQGRKRKKRQRGSVGKRCRTSPDSDSNEPESEDVSMEEDMVSEHDKSDIGSMTGRRFTRSLTAHQKSVSEDRPFEDTGDKQESPCPVEESSSSIVMPFITPYHCQPTFQGSSLYDIHPFKRMVCLVPPNGEILLRSLDATEFVAVPKNWPMYRNAGKGPMGGYLGKGTRKWAFEGYLVNSTAALFQPGGLHYYSGVDDTKSEIVLRYEFMSLMKADYHLQVFKARAKNYNVSLPTFRFNAAGSFLGTLVDDVPPKPLPGIPETRSMLNKMFLASPFIDMKNCVERCFTGRDGGGRSASDWQEMDHILAAFTHAVLVDSDHTVIITDLQGVFIDSESAPDNRELVLYDPQVHTISGLWSHDDDGFNIINQFLTSHRCTDYCRSLQLEGVSPASVLRPEHQKTDVTLNPEPKDIQPVLPSIQDTISTEPGASTSCLLPPRAPFQSRPPGPLRFGFPG